MSTRREHNREAAPPSHLPPVLPSAVSGTVPAGMRCLHALTAAAALLAGSLIGADAAETTVDVITDITPADIKTLMESEGYSVTLDKKGVVTWKIEGFRTHLFTAEDGGSIQFHASFSDGNATLKKVNEWNRNKRFSRTYLDEDGDPHLELDLDLEGGVTIQRVLEFLKSSRWSFEAWCRDVVE